VDRVHLVDGRLQGCDPVGLDAVVGAERRLRRALLPSLARRPWLLGRAVRPALDRADAVLVEALHGAAAARALVVLALPLVVEAGGLNNQARAYPLGPGPSPPLPPPPFR